MSSLVLYCAYVGSFLVAAADNAIKWYAVIPGSVLVRGGAVPAWSGAHAGA